MRRFLFLAVFAVLALSCGKQAVDSPPPVAPPDEDLGDPTAGPVQSVTYWADVQPILQTSCTQCHVQGGIAPFALDTYAAAKAMAPQVALATKQRLMPPWPPARSCGDFVGSHALPDAQIKVLSDWTNLGAPEGNPADKKPSSAPVPEDLGKPDVVVGLPSPYTPSSKGNDDYHCFVMDPNLTEDRDVIASAVHPGNPKIVHHVIIFEARDSDLSTVQSLDDKEEGPGYTCFGSPGFNGQWIVGWAPGGQSGKLPEGTGIRLHKGSKLVMQVHYNLLAARGESDTTTVDLHYSAQPVSIVARITLLPKTSIRLPAGQKEIVEETSFKIPPGKGMKVWGAAGHMHLLGTKFRMAFTRAADQSYFMDPASSEQCMLYLPRWDFHWQGMYMYREPIVLAPGDEVRMTCVYDNSAGNQPFIDGVQATPRTVHWGEGTTDEMCLGLLYTTDP